MLLYLIRHAQTASSAIDSFNGQRELPLTETGRAQAAALGKRLADVKFAAVYRSPLDRTRETAALVAPSFASQLITLPGLIEINYGDWEGHSPAEAEARSPVLFKAWHDDPVANAPPNGETAQDVATRALAALETIRARHEDAQRSDADRLHTNDPVLVVSHKATLRILACALLGARLANYRKQIAQDECALNLVELRAGKPPFIRLWNDTAHLGSDPAATTRAGH